MKEILRPAYVYVIQAADTDICKVGWAYDLDKRLASHQTGSPLQLFIRASYLVESGPDARGFELAAHRFFESVEEHSPHSVKWLRGEWFQGADYIARWLIDECGGKSHVIEKVEPTWRRIFRQEVPPLEIPEEESRFHGMGSGWGDLAEEFREANWRRNKRQEYENKYGKDWKQKFEETMQKAGAA